MPVFTTPGAATVFNRGENTEGVYVSMDMLLELRHQVEAERRLGIKRAQQGLPG